MQTNSKKSVAKKIALAALVTLSVGTSLASFAQRPPAPQGFEPESIRMIPDNENIASIMLVCTKPGLIPQVFVEGAIGLPNFILLTNAEVKFNEGIWEPGFSIASAEDLLKSKTSKRTQLAGGLILVDRIAKAKSVKIRWISRDKGGEIVLTTYNTTVAKSDPDLKQFLTKKCGVLGLK
jgi:hypothetical protein